jgi:hypothetical protein
MKDKRFVFILNILNIALIVLMAGIIFVLIALPFELEIVKRYFTFVNPTLLFFYTGGVLLFWFFYLLRIMILSVKKDTAFTMQNVKRLRILSIPLLLLAADFGYIMFYIPTISIVLCMVILVLGFFCSLVLSYLVQKAIEYKEDSDLTI